MYFPLKASVLLVFAGSACFCQTKPTLPKFQVDTDLDHAPVTGKSITVGEGQNLQSAIDHAKPGDEIVLQAGKTWTGTFHLPDKGKTGKWIRIRSSALSSLPAPGHRVSPKDVANMPKIVAPGTDQAFKIEPHANHYRLMGLEITEKPKQGLNYGLIMQGEPHDANAADLPSYITIDRCYIHGQKLAHIKFGWQMNGAHLAIIDSYVSEFHGLGQDTQALTGYMGPGPLKISNNFLEGAGENILFGGAYDAIPNTTTADVTFTGNYLYKPDKWRTESIVPSPADVSATAAAHGSLKSGIYYYSVIALGTVGTLDTLPGQAQSARSDEVSVKLTGDRHQVDLHWTEPTYGDSQDTRLADHYIVLRTSDPPKKPSRQWVYYAITPKTGNKSIAFTDPGEGEKTGFNEWARFWTVKNLFEIKNGVRWLVDGNLMQGNWVSAQNGLSILFTPRNENPFMPGNRITDITFTNNVIRHVAGGINIGSEDDTAPASESSKQIVTARLYFANNLFDDISWRYNGNGAFLQMGIGAHPGEPGAEDIVFDRNTIFQTGNTANIGNCCGKPLKNITVTNNIFGQGSYGWNVDGLGNSYKALTQVMNNLTFKDNVWAGGPGQSHYPGNYFPAGFDNVGFMNFNGGSNGNYHLAPRSLYKNKAANSTNPGANMDVLNKVIEKVAAGR